MTRQIAFFGCHNTLPGSADRREDAFEHDRQVAALRAGLTGSDVAVVEIDWRAPLDELTAFPLVLLGSSWDYTSRKDEFVDRLAALEKCGVIVCNPPEVVRWNADKSYLQDMHSRGIRTIPTLWLDDVDASTALTAFGALGTDRVVIKRRVGAGAIGQYSFSTDLPPPHGWSMGCAAMVQPFLSSICGEGEYSFVFIDGALSHVLRKRPTANDYRVQSLYGGREEPVSPSASDMAQAQAAIDALPFPVPLYARIDMVRDDDGNLCLMEAELIEPYLYPEQGPDLGRHLAQAILGRLSR